MGYGFKGTARRGEPFTIYDRADCMLCSPWLLLSLCPLWHVFRIVFLTAVWLHEKSSNLSTAT